MTTLDLSDVLFNEPEWVYRAKAKEHLSSHRLADFRACPLLFRKKELGLIPDEDRPAFAVGRGAHKLILEGDDAFQASFAVGGPVNERTGSVYGANTKAFAEWAREQGKPVLTDAQFELITNLATCVRSHATARSLLEAGSAEGVVRHVYCDVSCQARIDWFNPEFGIVDLKTTEDLDWFESDARRYGYLHQVAFYRSVIGQASGKSFDAWIVAIEKKEPYRCGVWKVGLDVLGMAQKENEAAIQRLQRCREQDRWPTGYEDIRIFDWM